MVGEAPGMAASSPTHPRACFHYLRNARRRRDSDEQLVSWNDIRAEHVERAAAKPIRIPRQAQ